MYHLQRVGTRSSKQLTPPFRKVATDVKKLLVLGTGAIGAGAVAVALLGAGVATADDGIVGQTYKDAKARIAQQGGTPIVATTVGDRKDWDNCIVSSYNRAPFKDGYGGEVGNQILVNLNCYSKYATSLWPGYSIQSPQGQEIYQADLAAKKQREAEEAAAAAQAEQDQLEMADAQQAGE